MEFEHRILLITRRLTNIGWLLKMPYRSIGNHTKGGKLMKNRDQVPLKPRVNIFTIGFDNF